MSYLEYKLKSKIQNKILLKICQVLVMIITSPFLLFCFGLFGLIDAWFDLVFEKKLNLI